MEKKLEKKNKNYARIQKKLAQVRKTSLAREKEVERKKAETSAH